MTEAGTKQGIKPETTRELLVEAIRHMVAGLERRTPPYAYPVLRALAGLAPPEVAEYAAETAAELAGDRRALPGAGDDTASAAAGAPPWVDDLARVTPGACHVTEDEFGETLAVLCEFSYRGGTESGRRCWSGSWWTRCRGRRSRRTGSARPCRRPCGPGPTGSRNGTS